MALFMGLNPDAMKKFSAGLRQQAELLQSEHKRVEAEVASLNWQGPDADEFRKKDFPALSAEVTALSKGLLGAAEVADRNVAAQIAVSAKRGG